jgi:hypothetical protein
MMIQNDCLSVIFMQLEPEEIYHIRSVNRQWNRVGLHVLGYSDTSAITIAENELSKLKKRERHLKGIIAELYQKRAEQYINNPKWQKYQIHRLVDDFNMHFGQIEGYVDPFWVWDKVEFGTYMCVFDHVPKCKIKTPLEGAECYCPISKFKFAFKIKIEEYNECKFGFSISYTDITGWTGIDPELTVKDFDKKTKCATIKPKYNPNGAWGGGNITHIIEHITQRVINYRIAWRRQMSKLIIHDTYEDQNLLSSFQIGTKPRIF